VTTDCAATESEYRKKALALWYETLEPQTKCHNETDHNMVS